MRILLVSAKGDGAWYVLVLQRQGHKVDWVVKHPEYAGSLSGIIPPPLSKPNPKNYDLIVYDSSGMGAAADQARLLTPTIGSSAFADKLENDRVYGIEVMEQAGIKVPDWESFASPADGIAWLKKNKVRTVLKPIGDAPKDATYVSKNAEDMIRYIETRLDKSVKSFVLQEFVEGVEVSTEAWWTGTEWVALNHTLEEKKLLSGGLGPNTGCAGNVLWMPSRINPLFQQGLDKVAPILKANNFVGMVDLNTIATEGDIYGLEWTPRFGYEGTCNLTRVLPMPFGDFLYAVATGKAPTLAQPRGRFAATVSLSVPPYPFAETSKKLKRVPIKGLDLERAESFMLYDVVKEGDDLFVEGHYMGLGAPIGLANSIEGAFADVQAAIDRLDVPDLQYRNDIKECVEKRYVQLERWGWLRPLG